jgi:heat shock protein HslJ
VITSKKSARKNTAQVAARTFVTYTRGVILTLALTAIVLMPQPSPPLPASPIEGRYWRATELAGKPAPAHDAKREAHLVLQAGGRFSGSDSCNRISGSYELKGEAIRFGGMVATRMACQDSVETQQAFAAVIKNSSRWSVAADRLELFDSSGARLARFQARPEAP